MTFTYPYLENSTGHVDLGGRLGFIYGSSAICALIFAFFYIPKTELLELEDIANSGTEETREALGVGAATLYMEPDRNVERWRKTSSRVTTSKAGCKQ
jgi:hypothetical protein